MLGKGRHDPGHGLECGTGARAGRPVDALVLEEPDEEKDDDDERDETATDVHSGLLFS